MQFTDEKGEGMKKITATLTTRNGEKFRLVGIKNAVDVKSYDGENDKTGPRYIIHRVGSMLAAHEAANLTCDYTVRLETRGEEYPGHRG